jgi:tetratricopeptide (TPR) repeat protein
LTRSLEKHLDRDELDGLVSLRGESVSGPERLSDPDLREAQRHVESCEDCSRMLQRHQFVHSEILRMRVPNPSPPTPACVGNTEWLDVAAGLLPEAKTRELMKHAAQCGHCGPLLKNAAEALADEATATEEALLASLQSARPEWSKNIAAALQDSVGDWAPKSSWWTKIIIWPTPAYALASIVAVAVVAWIGLRALHPASAEQLLAQAYSENRTLEVRIPGAKFAPLRVERGPSGSNLDKPQSLLRAEAIIGENLRKEPNNATWLQAKARADLLDGNFDSAITTLQRALQERPDSATLLTDLGSGYYARAESTNRPIDYGKAIDVLGRALARTPNDPVAVFNRAIVEEKLHLYNPAISDWQHYLELDPTGSWAEEARKRLLAIEEKVRTKQSSLVSPLLTPAQIIALSPKARADELNDRIEDYLREAVEKWLPDYIAPAARTQGEQVSADALTALADVLRTRHGDLWLSDLLAEPQGPIFDNGVMALSMALKADHNGNYATAQTAARNASGLFRTSRNVAAELRANLEQVYAEHLLYDGPSCATLAGNTISRLRSFKYQWLGAQVRLEESNCFDLLGNLGESKQALDLGTQVAKDHGFAELFVRGIGFQADAAAYFGDTQT